VTLAKDDDVIEKLAANASNHTLRGSVLPGLRIAVRFGSTPKRSIAWVTAG